MPSKLHLFTAGKGGTGKTLFALCTSLYYIEEMKEESLLIIDMNFHNADLYHSLRYAAQGAQTVALGKNFRMIPIRTASRGTSSTTKEVFLVFPDTSGRYYGLLPFRGILDIYSSLNTILRECKKKLDFEPDYCIVDTALHLSNLMPNYTVGKLVEARHELEKRAYLMAYEPHIWFVWTIAMTDRLEELSAAAKALRWLKSIRYTSDSWFSEGNLIHVINPHILTPPVKKRWWFSSIQLDQPCKIKSLDILLNSTQSNAIGFEEFYRLLQEQIRNDQGDDREAYFEIIAKAIGLRSPNVEPWHQWQQQCRRPRNVFANPYYDITLMGFTDNLERSKTHKLEQLIKTLDSVYHPIRYYLSIVG